MRYTYITEDFRALLRFLSYEVCGHVSETRILVADAITLRSGVGSKPSLPKIARSRSEARPPSAFRCPSSSILKNVHT